MCVCDMMERCAQGSAAERRARRVSMSESSVQITTSGVGGENTSFCLGVKEGDYFNNPLTAILSFRIWWMRGNAVFVLNLLLTELKQPRLLWWRRGTSPFFTVSPFWVSVSLIHACLHSSVHFFSPWSLCVEAQHILCPHRTLMKCFRVHWLDWCVILVAVKKYAGEAAFGLVNVITEKDITGRWNDVSIKMNERL